MLDVTHAWLIEGLTPEGRQKVEDALRGPAPPDPERDARENTATFGSLMGMAAKGLK